MKTILVPVDFSETSENAAFYAAEIAKQLEAQLILFHVYHIPFVQAEVPVMVPTIDQLEDTASKALIRLRAQIHTQHGPHIRIDHVSRCGFAVEEIIKFMNEQAPDIVVMGMHGTGNVSEYLLGSVTTSLIGQSNIPVLAVNKNSHFKGLKKLVFAYDYATMENSHTLDTLKTFGRLFKSHVYVLKVAHEKDAGKLPDIPEAVAGIRMDHLLEELNHSFHFITNKNVVTGINEFATDRDADLVVMVPHKHSFFERILSRSQTSHMAFNMKIPLLSLPR